MSLNELELYVHQNCKTKCGNTKEFYLYPISDGKYSDIIWIDSVANQNVFSAPTFNLTIDKTTKKTIKTTLFHFPHEVPLQYTSIPSTPKVPLASFSFLHIKILISPLPQALVQHHPKKHYCIHSNPSPADFMSHTVSEAKQRLPSRADKPYCGDIGVCSDSAPGGPVRGRDGSKG